MITIYAILLYFQLICACIYEKPLMDQIIQDNQALIETTQQDPVLMDYINTNYQAPAGGVVIIDLQEDR